MIINVQRVQKLKKYTYKIIGNSRYSGESNYTYGLIPRRIMVLRDNYSIMELKQTNWLLKFMNSLPVLNCETFTPFYYFENKTLLGKSKTRLFQPAFFFTIKENFYELRQHNHNVISLMENGAQIALYKKEAFTEFERNKYEIRYREDKEENDPLLLLFCIFIDVVFYSSTSKISGWKYEKEYVMKDPFPERTHWEDTI